VHRWSAGPVPRNPVATAKRGFFYSGNSTRWRCRNKTKRIRNNPSGDQGTTPSLISPDALLYYQSMDAAVLIPIAFLVAGSVAIILAVYMVR